ncbi:MAG: transposase [Saprospiraceae bacterium]|nr:transposase [Saprospiraceae bacterium]
MTLLVPAKSTYHLYNQGNNKRIIFNDSLDYMHFLWLYRRYLQEHCDLMAWCLMPNHYHMMLMLKPSGEELIKIGPVVLTRFANGVRLMQSKYSRYFNDKYCQSGSVFRQRAKCKCCDDLQGDYRLTLFNYIHYNPVESGLTERMSDWSFSSFTDYYHKRGGTLINKELTAYYLGIELDNSYF